MATRKKAVKKSAKKRASPKQQPLVKIAQKEVHWSRFLMAELGACSIPYAARHAATPQAAWDKLDGGELVWALNEAGAAHDYDGYEDADEIRKKYPTPPAKLQKRLERWLKAPATVSDIQDECDF